MCSIFNMFASNTEAQNSGSNEVMKNFGLGYKMSFQMTGYSTVLESHEKLFQIFIGS